MSFKKAFNYILLLSYIKRSGEVRIKDIIKYSKIGENTLYKNIERWEGEGVIKVREKGVIKFVSVTDVGNKHLEKTLIDLAKSFSVGEIKKIKDNSSRFVVLKEKFIELLDNITEKFGEGRKEIKEFREQLKKM